MLTTGRIHQRKKLRKTTHDYAVQGAGRDRPLIRNHHRWIRNYRWTGRKKTK